MTADFTMRRVVIGDKEKPPPPAHCWVSSGMGRSRSDVLPPSASTTARTLLLASSRKFMLGLGGSDGLQRVEGVPPVIPMYQRQAPRLLRGGDAQDCLLVPLE
jgi:hypothetical protein